MAFLRSTAFVPASEQSNVISSRYINSAHGIIWLNETLPPYMTRDYALAPFAPKNKDPEEEERNETWTASTTLYSLDLHCEAPRLERGQLSVTGDYVYNYMGINDCEWPSHLIRSFGNDTIDSNDPKTHQAVYDIKKFASFYVGYYSTDYSDYYLQGHCPETANHTW
jgi:hypothetical protein